MSVSFGALFWWSISHRYLKVALTPAGTRAAIIRFGFGHVAYLAAVGVAFLNAPASLLISGLVAGYYVYEQTPAGDRAGADAADATDSAPT